MLLHQEEWKMTKYVELFTDGACRGNPGPGGWGVIVRYEEHQKEFSGAELNTTNNRMELMAAIMGLSQLRFKCRITVTTDSRYVIQGITEWLANWKKKGWKTANNQPVKNQDLWQQLESLIEQHEVSWVWVKGHSGHFENELADQLANIAIDQLLSKESQ